MNAFAEELLLLSSLGSKWKPYIGAAISIGDGLTDAYMIRYYLMNGDTFVAWMTVGAVLLNWILQLLIIFGQWRLLKVDRRKVMAFEAALVITFLKPGWDAYSVVHNVVQVPGATNDALTNAGYCKASEMFAESIPGLFVQSVALLQSTSVTRGAIFSLFMSACSTGMTATSMADDNVSRLARVG
jgi:hypothetical protein